MSKKKPTSKNVDKAIQQKKSTIFDKVTHLYMQNKHLVKIVSKQNI